MAVALAAAAVAFLHGGNLVVASVTTHQQRVVMRHAGNGPVHWSGDGKLVSSGGKVAGGPTLPAPDLAWSPGGETAVYVTKRGGVGMWNPSFGRKTLLPNGWGAQSVAWVGSLFIAIGRTVCHRPCGTPTHHEVWLTDGSRLRRIVALPNNSGVPMPFAGFGRRSVLWWLWPNSGSIAADGVAVYGDKRKIGTMLMYPDWVAVCGDHLALAVGGDRNSMHGKSILYDRRNLSHDASRSWISPSCHGSLLVAAAGRNSNGPWSTSRAHRAIWELLPRRKQLTHPPRGWTDEWPTVLPDGSVLFVRTRQVTRKANGQSIEHNTGLLERLRRGILTRVADLSYTANDLGPGFLQYYGHYMWPRRAAVRP